MIVLLQVLVVLSCWLVPSAHSWTAGFQHRVLAQKNRSTCRNVVSSALEEPSSATTTTTTTTTPIHILADDPEIEKPERDPRQYRLVRLPNQLLVLLVCDGSTAGVGVEAASVHVKAGHFDDTVPGLAHFHEHMLFLGTQKYPDEDEYETFLNRYGGYSNAYTDMEDTNYYCSITTEADECFANPQNAAVRTTRALAGALDRLAQFFIAPTFDQDAVDREIQAIDSEYRNGKTSDSWRSFSLLKSTVDPKHPFANFGCGNKETLLQGGIDSLLRELETFWKTYYQPHNLRLTVVGHGSLDALQDTVMDTFGTIPAPVSQQPPLPRHSIQLRPNQFFPREHAVYNATAFESPGQLGLLRRVVPCTETRKLQISFATPPMEDPKFRQSKPYRALSHFLGHEAPGSLHALLQKQGLITGLSSGVSIDTSDFSLFTVTVALTAKGMEDWESVLDRFFEWVALLRQQSEEQLTAYHNELRQLSSNSFRFRENSDPTDFCSAMSELLFAEDFEPSDLLVFSHESGEYDSDIAKAFLDRFDPSNCFITMVSSDFDDEETKEWKEERWYGAKYSEEPFLPEKMQQWQDPATIHSDLQAPGLNQYIPTDFSLRCDDVNAEVTDNQESNTTTYPTVLEEDDKLRLWHKMDTRWRVPKTSIKAAFLSPSMYSTPLDMTLNRIFQRVLIEDLNSFVYDASVAGCRYKLGPAPSGFRLSVDGYSEKLPFLLETLTSRILSLIDEMQNGSEEMQRKFENAREALLRETKNYRLDAPYEVNNYNSRLLLEEKVWFLDDYITIMEAGDDKHAVDMGACATAAFKSLTHTRCEVLCMGNINIEEARRVATTIRSRFLMEEPPLIASEIPSFRSVVVPTRDEISKIVRQPVERNLPLIYQDVAFSDDEENNAVELFFQLDSEMELGYQGIALLDVLAHLASTSAFTTLRTNEQLGYIVSAHGRKTVGGGWGLSVVVQSSVAAPPHLEERIDAWLETYRTELESMPSEDLASEASAVAAQYLEKETKLSQEIGRAWSAILGTETMSDPRMRSPPFGRAERLATSLVDLVESPTDLKASVLALFDKHLSAASPQRRVLSTRLYRKTNTADFETTKDLPGVLSSHADTRYIKHFLQTLPNVPYWRDY